MASLFTPSPQKPAKEKSEKELAREKKQALAKLLSTVASGVTWRVSFTKLRAWQEDSTHPTTLGLVQPLMMSIHEIPGAGLKERFLWSATSTNPAMLFSFELVQEEVEAQAQKYDYFPGVLEFNEACYVAPFSKLYPGICVRACGPLSAELHSQLVKIEVEGKRAMAFNSTLAPLASSSPALLPCHMAAFVAATNALTACAPWEHGVPESQLFRVRFPGGATPAERHNLPPGEVLWVNIVGAKFHNELQAVMQRARAEGKPLNININISAPQTIFGAFVFRRRCDAEAKIMTSHAADLMRGMEKGIRPRYNFAPSDLPFPAQPNDFTDRHCTVCCKPGAVACSVCGEAFYCGGSSSCAAEERGGSRSSQVKGPCIQGEISHVHPIQCPDIVPSYSPSLNRTVPLVRPAPWSLPGLDPFLQGHS